MIYLPYPFLCSLWNSRETEPLVRKKIRSLYEKLLNAFLIKIQKTFSLSLDPLDLLISIGVSFAFHSFPRSPRPSLGGIITAKWKWQVCTCFAEVVYTCSLQLALRPVSRWAWRETPLPGLLTPVTSRITSRKSLTLSWLKLLSVKEPVDYPKASCSLNVLLFSVYLCSSSPIRLSAHKRQGFYLTFGTFLQHVVQYIGYSDRNLFITSVLKPQLLQEMVFRKRMSCL